MLNDLARFFGHFVAASDATDNDNPTAQQHGGGAGDGELVADDDVPLTETSAGKATRCSLLAACRMRGRARACNGTQAAAQHLYISSHR